MSWKKYGGTNKLETLNNLTVNSIVTDNLSLRKFYLGDWDICGGLRVKDNAIIYKDTDLCGNLIVGLDAAFMGEFTVNKDTNLFGNLVVLNDAFFSKSLYFDPSGNTLFDANNSGFGFNKYNPLATIDISSDRVQTVYMKTSTIENKNIYAQNVLEQGIVLSVDSGNAYIDMFVDSSMNSTGNGNFDARLKYVKGGNFVIDVSNVMNVRPRVVFAKDLSRTMNSDLERVVIYDSPSPGHPAMPYLKDVYADDVFLTGTSLALISQDNSSNVFMKMASEEGNGFVIGGGPFEGGLMGTLALTDVSGIYPAFNVFSGDLEKYLKTSIGINKHRVAKNVDGSNRYLLDINGPAKIIHQELMVTIDVSMQIFASEFCKTNTQVGYAIGSPYTISTPYERYFLKTLDGGYNWTRSRIILSSTGLPDPNLEQGTISFSAIYVFSETFILISGQGGFMYYSINGGSTWKIVDFNTTTNFDINALFSNLTNQNTILGLSDGTFIDTNAFSNQNSVSTILINSAISPFVNNRYASGLSNILSIDGRDNFIYMVGVGGIQGYLLGSGGVVNAGARFETGSTFLDVSVFYGSDGRYHSVAVGANGLIRFTHSLLITNSWYEPFTAFSGTLNSVHVISALFAIAVGENGLMMYSIDGFFNWKIISHAELNAMGNGELISSLSLSNIFSKDYLSDFSIVGDVQTYSSQQQSRTKIFNLYAPYFFNRANNFVLEASGSIMMSGDLRINDNGNIFTNSDAISIFPDVATTINIGNTSIGGNTNVKHNLNVVGNAHIYQKLIVDSYSFLNNDVSLNGRLYVTKDASMNSNLFVGKDVSFGSKLYVVGDVSMNNRLFVGKDVSFGSKLYVVGDVSMNSNLFVGKDVSFGSKLYVVGDVSMNSNLFVGKDVSLGSKLYVVGDVSMNNRLFVGKDVSLGSKLYVVGDVSMNSNLFVGKDVSFGSKLYVVDDVSMNSNLFVGKDVSLGSKLYVVDDVSMNNRMFVGKDVSFGSKLYVVGDASMNNRLFVGKDVSLGSKLYVVGDVSMNSNLFVGRDVSLGRKLYVVGDASLNSNLFVGKELRVAGKSEFNSDVSINANLFVFDVSAQNMDLRGTRNSDGVGSGALIVQGGASIGSDLNVGGNLYINNYLDVVDGTDHIHFGYTNTRKMYIGSSDFTDEIRIGTSISGVRNSDVDIYIGSETNSRVHILGNLLLPGYVTFENQTNLEIVNKTILLNDQAAPGTSYGAGIYIREDGNDQAGQILVNPNMSGFFLKATRSPNIINFETNGMVLPAGLGRGILTIVPTTTGDGSNYTIARGVVDISDIAFLDASLNNRVMRNPVTSLTQVNTQVIDGKLSMTGLYVNKLEAEVIGNAQVDVAGNAIVSRLGLDTSTVRSAYVLDINGNTFSNGTILQW